ncbi:galactose mutarotase-like domain-containing protein [Hyaloscypha finlandica]|nr:galactose mutarotase-like domain-containing protein [Hyaloscypha finlandica]
MIKALFTLLVLPLSVLSAWAPPGPDGKYTLTAPGITAKFIPYAASITNLVVPDRNGTFRDVILGYDNATFYPVDPNHPDYGAVPGRYPNRIANHTGLNGWSRRTWNVSDLTTTSITFTIRDESNSSMGFPGLVLGTVTHSVSNNTWSTRLSAVAVDHDSPIMLTTHPYWNLDSFNNPKTDLIFNHTLSLPFSTRMLGIDKDTQCTGALPDVARGSINDFWSKPKQLSASMSDPAWWVVDRNASDVTKPVASLSSDYTGIKWDLYTDQSGVVVYSCHWMGGRNQLKQSQLGPATNGFAQDWIDGINHPEWGHNQIHGSNTGPFSSWISYTFSTI